MTPRTMTVNATQGALAQSVTTSRVALYCIAVAALLGGCGSATPPKIAERPDVIVTLDGKRHACVVALEKEPQGSAVPCKDAVSFVKDELRVQQGSVYDIHTVADVTDAEIANIRAALDGAGYRFIGGRKLP